MTDVATDTIVVDAACTVAIHRQPDGVWQVRFLDASGKPAKAPDVTDAKVESIGDDFIVRVLTVTKGADDSTLTATGKTERANYARVSVQRNGVWSVKYALLKNTQTPVAQTGPKGGPMVDMGHESYIEVTARKDKPWELTFYEGPTDEVNAPSPSIILVEVLRPDGTIGHLDVQAGPKPSMLLASGPTDNTTRVRLLWQHADHFHRREFNLPA